jgi:hypothetical protein
MGFSFIASASNYTDTSGTALSCSSTLNIAAKDTIVCLAAWNADTTTTTMDQDDSSNALTEFATVHNDTTNMALGYLLVAAADATATFRVTLGAARQYRGIIVLQFRPDGTDTLSLDAGPSSGTGTGTAVASGNINTTGTDEIIIGGVAIDQDITSDSGLIGGGAATMVEVGPYGDTAIWYRIYTTDPGDGINASATADASYDWACDVLAIKSVAGGNISPFTIRFSA